MSYPVSDVISCDPLLVANASYSPNISALPLTTNDDVVWLYVTAANASTTDLFTISGTGWTPVVTSALANNPKIGLFYCVVAGGTVAQPVLTMAAGTVVWLASAWVERDCEVATDPVDSYALSDTASNMTSLTTPTHTPATDNCRIIYLASSRGSGGQPYLRMHEAEAVGEVLGLGFGDNNFGLAQLVASVVQDTKASTAGKTVWNSQSGRMNIITLAIQNKSGGKRAMSGVAGVSRLLWGGSFSIHDTALTPTLTTTTAPTNPRTINGIAVSATAATRTTDALGPTIWGLWDNYQTAVSGGWQGTRLPFTADVDMRNVLLSVEFFGDLGSFFDQEGIIIVLEDSTQTNWRAFQIHQRLGWVRNKPYTAIIDLVGDTIYDEGGAFDPQYVRSITPLVHRLPVTTSRGFGMRNWSLLSKSILTGGNINAPQTINFLRKLLGGFSLAGLVGGDAPAVTVKAGVQIGDGGTTPTYFDATGTLLTFPAAYDPLSQREWQVGANKIDITINADYTTDTINLTATTLATALPQNLTIDAASTVGSQHSEVGMSVVGPWDVTWKTGVSATGPTYSGCDKVNFKGANVTNVTITDTSSTDAAASWDVSGATLTTSTIDLTGTSADYHISLGASVTSFEINGTTLSGTPGTDKFYSALASGTLTITTDGTGTAIADTDVTFIGGSTATAVIASPTTYRGLNFTGLVDGSKVKVFTAGSQTVLFGTDSVTSNAFAFDDSTSGSTTVDYTIQKAGYVPIRVTGAALNGSTVQATGRPDTAVNQVIDRAYVASSGLTYGTTAVVTVGTNPTTNPGTKTFQLTTASTGQNWYSFWIEQWIDKGDTGEALANVEFPLAPNGPNSFTLNDGWTFSDGATSIAFLTRDGLRYLNTSDVLQKAWAAILTSGVPSGKQVRYQQSDGGTTVNAVNTGEMDQLIQIYDVGVFDYRGYLVLKVQTEGYDQAEANVVTLYGTLEDQLYVVGLTPTANGIATGNPTVTLTLDRGTYNDVTSGKTFGIRIVSADSGEDILRELRYNFGAGGEYPAASGYDGFDWHDLVQVNGADFKTVRGNLYGTAAVKGVVVYSTGTTLHPDFTLFTADDGTTYAPAVTADISITSMPDAGAVPTRLQIINSTATGASTWVANTVYATGAIVKRTTGLGSESTAGLYFRATTGGTSHATTEPTWDTTVGNTTADNTVVWTTYAILYYDDDPAATSLTDTYIDGEEFLDGESVEVRFAEMDGSTSFKTYSTTAVVNSAGFSVLVSEDADDVYATNALDGSDYEATFSPNFTLDYMVLDTNTDFAGKAAFAYYCYTLTTSAGMWGFWGGVTALDEGNYRVNTAILNLYFDESAGFVKQTDNVRIFRDDGLRPAIDPTTGGHGIEINWRTPVSVVTTGGSAVLPQDIVDIAAASAAAVVSDGKTLTVPKFLGLK